VGNLNQRLNGYDPLAYTGTNALQPTDFRTKSTDPTPNDSKNFLLGTWWLNTNTLALWYLAALSGNVATWLRVTLGGASLFQGNAGGLVAPDNAGVLHIVGDTITATVVGNPGTHTLTISSISSYQGNSGGVVHPNAGTGVLNVVGDGVTVNVAGNPGTNTLTISSVGSGTVETLTGDSGGAVGPSAGNINVLGTGANFVVGNPGTHTLSVFSPAVITGQCDSGVATASSNNMIFAGGTGISTSGSGNTVTITNTGTNPPSTVSFFAYNGADIIGWQTTAGNFKVPFTTTLFDLGSNYSTVTSTFTAPATGYYSFSIGVSIYPVQNTTTEYSVTLITTGGSYLYTNGNPFAMCDIATANSVGLTQTCYVPMSMGDTAYVNLTLGGSLTTINLSGKGGALGGQYRTVFSGYRVA